MPNANQLAPDVDRSRISPQARIEGCSYVSGARTVIEAGAVVHDSRVHDATIEGGASVMDSIVCAEGGVHSHKCDAAGRVVVRGAEEPRIERGARVHGSTLLNTSVGTGCRVLDTWATDCQLGPDNVAERAKLVLVNSARSVTISGPTEVSEAYLGHHASIDERGYFEGVFSNQFLRLCFDGQAGRLRVVEVIDLPHVSRYGLNTINSTNSGKLKGQPDGVVHGFGPHVGLWHDAMLSHEQIELAPCCWVLPWTKVVGQSAAPHHGDEALVNDPLTTYMMPFSMAGYGGDLTQALVMPGELSVGLGPKRRFGAWVFTYAPDAVIEMVSRLWQALASERKHVADTIVIAALHTALAITQSMAAQRQVDLAVPAASQRRGWPTWLAQTYALLKTHLDSDLWQFRHGKPADWCRQDNKWMHPRLEGVLQLAPDALDKQVSEAEMFEFVDPVPAVSVALPYGTVPADDASSTIDERATVAADAWIGPGCHIGPGTTVESGAALWHSVVESATIERDARIERSTIEGGAVGAGTTVRSSHMSGTTIGSNSNVDAARMRNATLVANATVSAFSDVLDTVTRHASIIGGTMHHADIDVNFMSMHMAGACQHLDTVPVTVTIDGRAVSLPTVPMFGGGCVIQGTVDEPVRVQGAFIGSNAIIEHGAFIGFGSFVLGRLAPGEGLLPFTVSTRDGAPQTHQIGAVLSSLPSLIITHFVNWNFQLIGPRHGEALAQLIEQVIAQAAAAIEAEQRRRRGAATPGDDNLVDPYRSLPRYSDGQLQTGLTTYRKGLASGAWSIRFDADQLHFADDKGQWHEKTGSALWRPATTNGRRAAH